MYMYVLVQALLLTYVTGSGKIQHFAYSIKIGILLYLASIMSEQQNKCANYEHLQFYHQWSYSTL